MPFSLIRRTEIFHAMSHMSGVEALLLLACYSCFELLNEGKCMVPMLLQAAAKLLGHVVV